MLAMEEREEFALAHTREEGVGRLARTLGREPSVISRELRRNRAKRGYRATAAHECAQARRVGHRPPIRERLLGDLGRGRTPARSPAG